MPEDKDSLAQVFRCVHRHYSRRINFRENWKGHLWQERFHSFVMDESFLLATVRYTEINPVRARLCKAATDWSLSIVVAALLDGCLKSGRLANAHRVSGIQPGVC